MKHFVRICSFGLLLMLLLCFTKQAEASHFRYGNITWRVISGNTIEFKVSQAWRYTAFYPTIGRTIHVGSLYLGNGASAPIYLKVTSINTAEDWFYGEATITYTYPTTGNYLALFSSCCKISTLSNNRDGYWRVETVVTVGNGNNSPVTTSPPIINLPQNLENASTTLAVTDPDGDALSFRLATYSEMSGSNPNGLTVDASGIITFNTVGKTVGQLWNAAVAVTDNKGAKVVVDFIIKITQQSTAPVFDYSVTPLSGSVIQVAPGQAVNFNVKASDSDPGDNVSLQAVGLPSGASLTPALPTSGNPVQTSFSWTPTNSSLGANVISFIAQDNQGVQKTSSVTILVSLKPVFDVPPTPAAGQQTVYAPGQQISYTVQASDPDPDDVVKIIGVEGKDANGNKTPLYSGASFSSLPTASGNPTSGTFSWTPQASDWGQKNVYFTAEDGYGDRAVHEVSQLINTTPVFTSTPLTTADVGQLYTYTIKGTDPDVAFGDQLKYVGVSVPSWLTLTDHGDGTATLSGTPSTADAGSNFISIQLEDINHHTNIGGIPLQSFTIVVNDCVVKAVAKDFIAMLDNDGKALVSASDVDDGSSATCGIASLSLDKTAFNCANLGANKVTLTVTDINGNNESTLATVTVVDDIAPEVVTKNITIQLDENGNANITPAEVDNGSSDACGIQEVRLDKTIFSCAEVGENIVTLTVTDNNGNSNTATAKVIVEDKIAPTVLTKDITIQLDENGQASITSDDIDAGSSDICGIKSYSLNKIDFSCTDIGIQTVILTVTDMHGNSDFGTATVTVEDKVAPTVVAQGMTVKLDENGEATLTVEDIDGGSFDACGIATKLLDITSFTCDNIGVNTVTLTVIDNNGNSSSATASVTVEDTGAPTVLTNDITVYLNAAGTANITTADIDAGTFDNCEVASLTLDQTSFGCSDLGANEVTLTATDIHGNSASATAKVTVADNIAPVAVTKPITVKLDASGQASITPQDVDNGSSDNCDFTLSLDKISFSCADLGEQTVTLTATDGSSNIASSQATVTVVDNIAPAITAPAEITVGNDPGLCGALVSIGTPVSSDNCGVAEVSNDAPLDGIFAVGTTTITWTAVDASGNESYDYQYVTVTNSAPVITGISAPIDPIAVGSSVNVSATFTDNNLSSATWNWGDGSSSGVIGTGNITGSHTYSLPGLYTLSLTVEDMCGEYAAKTLEYNIVIYDPYGGFVTGGGWIDSPEGASVQYPEAVGKANFGFFSKYKKGATIPTGDTEFKFKAGNLYFESLSYEWLVVAGSKAKFKGVGTINGSGNYGFMLTATDGSPDLFRIKIWDKMNGDAVVYDNQPLATDDSYSGTKLGGGSIVVHDPNGKNARYDNTTTAGNTLGEEGLEIPATFKLNVYPNPVQEKLAVELESETEEEVTISIFDLMGRKLYEQKQPVMKGNNQIILDVASWKVTTDQLLFRLQTPSKGLHQLMLLKPE